MAFTGPFCELTACPIYWEPQYDPLKPGLKSPRQEFHTIPLGPQLQVVWRTEEGSNAMWYWQACYKTAIKQITKNASLTEYTDVWDGSEFLNAVQNGCIKDHDPVLIFPIDGTQLYRNKASNC